MNDKNSEFQLRIDRFKQTCRDAGVKLTRQRLEIFRELALTEDHPDAEAIYRRVRTKLPQVSLDTVYRTLWMLNDLGLIDTLGQAHDRTRFDANLNHHHHFACVRCGLIRDFYCDDLDRLNVRDAIRDVGEASSMHLEVRGLCHECAQIKVEEEKT